MCGEAVLNRTYHVYLAGPSPRVRGSRSRATRTRRRSGSIPACAGKPTSSAPAGTPGWVHPRVCGEASGVRAVSIGDWGPSPRVRGSLERGLRSAASEGSIPACAGKPLVASSTLAVVRVHPRVCGEAARRARSGHYEPGPSPRVRGSPRSRKVVEQRRGSIPACAGKPSRAGTSTSAAWVHPRVCGEAVHDGRVVDAGWGPSPRVRGSLRRGMVGPFMRGFHPPRALGQHLLRGSATHVVTGRHLRILFIACSR